MKVRLPRPWLTLNPPFLHLLSVGLIALLYRRIKDTDHTALATVRKLLEELPSMTQDQRATLRLALTIAAMQNPRYPPLNYNNPAEWRSLVEGLCPADEISGTAAAFRAALIDMCLRGEKMVDRRKWV
jgi:hypothetical protein